MRKGSLAASPLPAGPFPIRAIQPETIGSADLVMVGVDALRFGTATGTSTVEWFFALPFSEITELRNRPSAGAVSGTLRDGTDLEFRIDQGLAAQEAMGAVESLIGPGAGADIESAGNAAGSGRRRNGRSQSLEDAFHDADECDAGLQVRRFAQLAADAGLDTDRFKGQRRIVARWPGTKKTVFEIYWQPDSRFNIGAYRTGAFGKDESKAFAALPRAKRMRSMDGEETIRYLFALEMLLATYPVIDVPGGRIQVSASVDSTASDDRLAAALQALDGAFEDAEACDTEPQVKRFARLTLVAGLEIRWGGTGWRQIDAVWREADERVFTIWWYPRSRFSLVAMAVGAFGEAGDAALTGLPKTRLPGEDGHGGDRPVPRCSGRVSCCPSRRGRRGISGTGSSSAPRSSDPDRVRRGSFRSDAVTREEIRPGG